MTSNMQAYRTPSPDILDLNPDAFYLEPFRRISLEGYERRASGHKDIQYYDTRHQDYKDYQAALKSDFSRKASTDNFSALVTYGGTSQDLVLRSDATKDYPVLNTQSPKSDQSSPHSRTSSIFTTSNRISNFKTQKYIPTDAASGPSSATPPTKPSAPLAPALRRRATAPNIPTAVAAPDALTRIATAPAVQPPRAQSFAFQRPAYCPRCLFWLNYAWAEAEALIKGVTFIDPNHYGLNPPGLDKEGHFRINDRACPVCEHERYIIAHASDDEEEDFLHEQFDRILDTWTHQGLIKGMTSSSRRSKESMMAHPPKLPPRPRAHTLSKSTASAKAKKIRDMGLPLGVWEAMEIGLEITTELLAAV